MWVSASVINTSATQYGGYSKTTYSSFFIQSDWLRAQTSQKIDNEVKLLVWLCVCVCAAVCATVCVCVCVSCLYVFPADFTTCSRQCQPDSFISQQDSRQTHTHTHTCRLGSTNAHILTHTAMTTVSNFRQPGLTDLQIFTCLLCHLIKGH